MWSGGSLALGMNSGLLSPGRSATAWNRLVSWQTLRGRDPDIGLALELAMGHLPNNQFQWHESSYLLAIVEKLRAWKSVVAKGEHYWKVLAPRDENLVWTSEFYFDRNSTRAREGRNNFTPARIKKVVTKVPQVLWDCLIITVGEILWL